ncbi:MAG: DUF748 domain-containing protein [Deltaproteobacteria bacterium]|nr:DUF748 domain-containing protein [Nannocystaceae bacterium]
MADSIIASSTEPSLDGNVVAARRPRIARALAWAIVVIATLTVLRLLAVLLITPIVTARASAALGVPVVIDDLELGLLAGEVTARGVHAAPAEGASKLDVEAVTASWRWRPLLRGRPFLDVAVSGVAVTIDLEKPWPNDREPPDPERKRSSALHSLEVEGGEIALVLGAGTPPLLALSELHAKLEETSTGARTDAMTARYEVTAATGEGGSLAIDGMTSLSAPAATWTLHFALERLDLRPLNPLFQAVFEMDVDHGWFSLNGEVNTGLGRVRGRLRPRFEELQLLGNDELRVRHPMAEALFSSMLSGADLPVDIDQAVALADGTLVDDLAELDGMELLGKVILNGFIRRLDTLDGYESSVARIEVDFPAGRMSFFDVALNRIGGAVGRPFVAVAQLDIIVDQAAALHGVTAYKTIVLHQPSLVFVTGTTPQRSQNTFDPDWQEKVSVLPYPTDKLEIIDGRVEYVDDTTLPSTSLFASSVQLKVDGIGRARVDGSTRGATLAGSARFMDLSALTLDVAMTPGSVPLDASVHLAVETVELAQLNELLHGRFGIDISTGTMALTADFDAQDGKLRGTVAPVIRDVRVLGKGETELLHPVRELMLERRLTKLDGAALELDYQVRFNLMRELPGAMLSAALNAEKVPQHKVLPAWRVRAKANMAKGAAERKARRLQE